MSELHSYLKNILAEKRRRIEDRRMFLETIRKNTSSSVLSNYSYFKKNISQAGRINLIAEIKKASPSKGVIREDFGVAHLSRIYHEAGAAALSVLTEEAYFKGRPDYVRIAADYDLPVLAKDFFIDELQIHEAFSYGAKAILLIMAILDDDTVRRFLDTAGTLDMDCLVEVHTEQELERALSCGAGIIGVNNRDLKTFEVDMDAGAKVLAQVPADKIRVIESGIATRDDVARFASLGANAVLIGEIFLGANDVAGKIREVMGG